MDRRTLLLSSLGVAAAAYGGWRYANAPRPRPRADLSGSKKSGLNILLVVTDQERSWEQYPAGFIETHCPGRMRLRESGVSIDGAHTPIQLCSMARGVIYTGAHSPNNGVWENVPVPMASDLSTELPTLGTMLQDAGYRTGYAGKWHLTNLYPQDAPLSAAEVQSIIRSYGFDETANTSDRGGVHGGLKLDGQTIDDALGFIRRRDGQDQPWFLAVNIVNPHDIMYYTSGEAMTRSRVSEYPDPSVRPPDAPLYQDDLGYDVYGAWGPETLAGRPAAVSEYVGFWDNLFGRLEYDEPRVAREFQNYYWNCMRDSDRHIDRLLAGLDASGQADRTIIVFTSDHGEFLGVHGLRGKGVSAYREGSKVPMVIRHPDGLKSHSAKSLVSFVDIAPTLLSFAGVAPSTVQTEYPYLAGHDVGALAGTANARTRRDEAGVLTYWTGLAYLDRNGPELVSKALSKTGLSRRWATLNAVRQIDWTKRGHMRGLYDGRWKFSRYFRPGDHHVPLSYEELVARNDVELYDTQADPEELTNMASDSAQRLVIEDLNRRANALALEEIGADDGDFVPFFAR